MISGIVWFKETKAERRAKLIDKYLQKDIITARKFAKLMYKEFGGFLKAVVLFGSSVKTPGAKFRDLDVLIILDDVSVVFSKELVETYRIVTERCIASVDPERLHIQSMKFTQFWEYVRAGDPVAINILRSGLALVDTGFFDPLQALLDQGRIRPSDESIYTYFTMAPASLHRSKQHLLTATIDLYWAAVDAAHAALMKVGEIPPSPDHVADMLQKRLVNERHVSKKYADVMRKLYVLSKKITHREIQNISGPEYEKYRKLAESFVSGMKKFIEKR